MRQLPDKALNSLAPRTVSKRIVLAGGSGFLGQVLARHFLAARYEVAVLTRRPGSVPRGCRGVIWDGRTLENWIHELDGVEALINLAGRSVNCRYHAHNRQLILDSRINSTRVLGEAIARCAKPPRVWLNSSTATIYRHTFGPAWDESGEIGGTREAKDEFSVEVACAWERTLNEAFTPATRKVLLRSAMVLGTGANSVFPVIHRMTRCGLGGRLASGRQFVSWIHETDFCRTIEWLIGHDDLSGPVNVASPNPVTNAEMMSTLRAVCRVPFGMPSSQWMLEVGAFFLRTETELLIKSRRVVPCRLSAAGFDFNFPLIKEAFENLCAKMRG